MTMSAYPGGFKDGILIRNLPLQVTYPGKILWVGNGAGASSPAATYLQGQKTAADTGNGTFNAPYATWNYALTQCAAGRGDVIFVKPNHAETISGAAGVNMAISSVATIGLGYGGNRPKITLDTAATATVSVAATNQAIKNILFVANFADIVTCINVANAQVATHLTIEDCEFRDTSSVLNFISAVKFGTTANIMDGFLFKNNKVFGLSTTAATCAITGASNTDRVELSGNYVVYPVLNDTAALATLGTTDHTNLMIRDNTVFRPNTSSTGGTLFSVTSTACTGMVRDNYVWHLDNSAGLLAPTGTKLGFSRNFCMITGAADKSALENPVAV